MKVTLAKIDSLIAKPISIVLSANLARFTGNNIESSPLLEFRWVLI